MVKSADSEPIGDIFLPQDEAVPLRSTIMRGLMIFLPLIAIVWLSIGIAIQWFGDAAEQVYAEQAKAEITAIQRAVDKELEGLLNDLDVLLNHRDIASFLAAPDDVMARRQLENVFYDFSATKRLYDQVRYIDAQGWEKVRVDHATGKTVLVPQEKLQDKAKRYYFTQTMERQQGEYFVSELDLNIEYGQLERPLKPMLRIAAPVFHAGSKRGIIVLNYLASKLLALLSVHSEEGRGRVMLLNADGYYLRGPSSELEWGNMFPHASKERRFSAMYPAVWTLMQSQSAGQWRSSEGLFTFCTLRFPPESAGMLPWNYRQWVLLLHSTKKQMNSASALQPYILLLIGALLTLLFLLLSLLGGGMAAAAARHKKRAGDLGKRLQVLMHTTPDAILSVDEDGVIESFNPAAEQVFGCGGPEIYDYGLEQLVPDDFADLQLVMRQLCGEHHAVVPMTLKRELQIRRCSGERLPVELFIAGARIDGRRLFTAIVRDISSRHADREQIRRQTFYDELTQLPNRALLRTELDSILASASRRAMHGAVLFMDLDNFKTINDSLGHNAGDAILRQVAMKIRQCLRTEDVVARIGGDEFVVVLPMLGKDLKHSAMQARGIAEKIRSTLNAPVSIEGHEYVVTPSIGLVMFPAEAEHAEDLLRQADTAMYRAKGAGRNTVRIFQPRMQKDVDERLAIGKQLHQAVANGELELYFQPQIDLDKARVVGAEALIRWHHPSRGFLGPGAFIPQAEELGVIGEIGEWVLREGFRSLNSLHGNPLLETLDCLALNISPRHFRQADFFNKIKELMQVSALPYGKLELEITENLLLEDIAEAISKMQALRELGVSFAIDDFGIGFSSLGYLRRLPVERLKIDRSFISGVDKDPHNASIVDTILAMARVQGMQVTAEGVETEHERDWLRQRGCTHIQGFFYSRPLPFDDFVRFCDEFSHRAEALTEMPK
jgi:diguanylate cyclase (GGDEF)-like protein/PAS domain S-box-containing protein